MMLFLSKLSTAAAQHLHATFIEKENRNKIIFIMLSCAVLFAAQAYYDHQFNQALIVAAETPTSSWDESYQDNKLQDSYKVVIVPTNDEEYNYAEYFKYAAEQINWKVHIHYNNVWAHENELLAFDPDFILFCFYSEPNLSTKLKAHRSKKYLLNFNSFQRMRNAINAKISKLNPYKPLDSLKKYIDTMHGVLSSANEIAVYSAMFKNINKPFNGIRVLPSVPDEHYATSAQPRNLMWASWGENTFKITPNYKAFIKLLSERVPMKVYGSYNAASHLAPGVYDGMIGPGMANIRTIREHGIYLLTHDDEQLTNNEFNAKVFEAVAAGAVVISDKHPFMLTHFGDSFLYFDHTDASAMYEQVKQHLDWIKANPEKAAIMAAKANNIYREKFALNDDLIRIAKMHEGVIAAEKVMHLSHNLSY